MSSYTFNNDSFISWITSLIKNKNSLRQILLAYRMAKYSQLLRSMNVEEPKIAVKFLTVELNHYIKKVLPSFQIDKQLLAINITALLLDYVINGSKLLTMDDVYFIFGKMVFEKVRSFNSIETIVSSNAKITNAKRKQYVSQFTHDDMFIKACIIITKLKLLDLSKCKTFPIKVHSRYVPIFDAYIEIGNKVATELRRWLLHEIRQSQQNDQYNLTVGDLFSYFSIVSDKRLKVKSISSLKSSSN